MNMPQTENSEQIADILGMVVDDYLERRAAGEQPDVEEYVGQHPQLADVIRQSLRALEVVGDSLSFGGTRSHDADLGHGKALGDFRLLGELGRGGMGVVYEAEQISLGRFVALKILPFASLVQDKALRRFQNEVRAAAALDHPNIVSVYSVSEERGVHYYAMQLIRGQTLAEVIGGLTRLEDDDALLTGNSISQILSAADAPGANVSGDEPAQEYSFVASISRDQVAPSTGPVAQGSTSTLGKSGVDGDFFRSVAHLGIQAANALQHAHDLGILHRDIKPGNLMLDAEMQLYVTDFGLARIEADAGMTMTGDLVGTLRYMSPEQALAKRIVIDHRSDVYSLGMTLYELLTLRPAFGTADRQEVLKQIAFEDPVKPRQINRLIPHDLETIVLKAIEKNPDDRYATAGELAGDLRAYLEDRPIKAKPPTLVQRAKKWARRHRQLAATFVTAFLLLVCGVIAALVIHSREASKHARAVEAVLSQKSRALAAAQAAQQHAEQQRRIAQEQRLRAENSELVARRRNYLSEMQLAFDRRSRLMLSEAARILDRQVPDDGEPDARGLEWDILSAQLQAEMYPLGRHTGAATECALFPDGRTAASVGEDGLIHLYDLRTRSKLKTLAPKIGPIHALAVSPDGKTLAIGGSPSLQTLDLSRVYLLDAETGERKNALHQHATTIESIAFSPDGQKVASGARYQDVKISMTDGTLLHTFPAERRNETIAFSPAGELLAALYDKRTVRIRNADSGELVRDLPFRYDLSGFAWAQDGSQIVVLASSGPVAGVIDIEPSRTAAGGASSSQQGVLHVSSPRPRRLTAVAYSTGGTAVWAGDLEGQIRQWQPRPTKWRQERGAARGHVFEVKEAAQAAAVHNGIVTDILAIRGGHVLTTCGDGSVMLSQPYTPATCQHQLDFSVTAAKPDRNGNVYVASSVGTVSRFDLTSGVATTVLDAGPNEIADFSICEDASQLAVIYRSGSIDVFDMDSGARLWSPKAPSEYSRHYRTAYSEDGRFFANTGFDNTFRVWDARRRIPLLGKSLSGKGRSVAFSPDGDFAACGNDRIRIFDLNRKAILHELAGGDDTLSMQFCPNGRKLASGHFDGSTRLFDLTTQQVRVLRWHQHPVTCVVFSPDGSSLITTDGKANDSLLFWDVETGEAYGSLHNPFVSHPEDAEYRILVSGSQLIAYNVGTSNATLTVWPFVKRMARTSTSSWGNALPTLSSPTPGSSLQRRSRNSNIPRKHHSLNLRLDRSDRRISRSKSPFESFIRLSATVSHRQRAPGTAMKNDEAPSELASVNENTQSYSFEEVGRICSGTSHVRRRASSPTTAVCFGCCGHTSRG